VSTLSALAHCEMAAVDTASVIKIMMMAANCATLFANSFILPSPESLDMFTVGKCLSNVYASTGRMKN
jgi:hypothetical protein